MATVDDYVDVPSVGDEIVSGLTGNHYKIVGIDYDNCTVNATSAVGERYLFSFDGFEGGVYNKV